MGQYGRTAIFSAARAAARSGACGATASRRRRQIPPNKFIVGSLFGWQWLGGVRRFRNAYIEVGKGNGKTPLLAAIGLYGLMSDGQKAPEIYAAAADRDQAMIMFRDAVRMVDASPELAQRIRKSGIQHVHNMTYGLGFFRPFSREQGTKSGTRPHMGLIDEVHEHPTPEICAKIRAGAKGNENALFPEITNAGFDRTSICWQHHEHSVRIVEQVVEDERWFAYVCALDAGDDPLTDRRCHVKTNPNLGVSIQQAYLDDQVATAQHIPAETNMVLRLNFCVWTLAHTPAWDMAKWRAAADPVPPLEALVGCRCFGGLDLGQNDDFAAWVLLFNLPDGRVAMRVRFWLPEAALVKFPNRPYDEWRRAGLLESIKSFSKLIADGAIVHGQNRVLTWMMDNCVLRTGRNQEVRLDKDVAKDKIDGPSAIVMANARRIVQPEEPTYQMIVFGGPTL